MCDKGKWHLPLISKVTVTQNCMLDIIRLLQINFQALASTHISGTRLCDKTYVHYKRHTLPCTSITAKSIAWTSVSNALVHQPTERSRECFVEYKLPLLVPSPQHHDSSASDIVSHTNLTSFWCGPGICLTARLGSGNKTRYFGGQSSPKLQSMYTVLCFRSSIIYNLCNNRTKYRGINRCKLPPST